MDETNDKINKLKSKIDKLYHEMNKKNKENIGKDRMKQLKSDLKNTREKDNGINEIDKLENSSKNFLDSDHDEDTDFRYVHPNVDNEKNCQKDEIYGTSPVTKAKIDALILKLRGLRS